MLNDGGLTRVFGLNQMFLRRNKLGRITLIIAKVTDDFLIGGKMDYIHEFLERLQKRFTVGKIVIDKRFLYNGCEIEQDFQGNIQISMMRYIDKLHYIVISRKRRKEGGQKATNMEMKHYRALAGTLLYLGNGVLPQAALVVSIMQQRTANLLVQDLVDANKMLKELLHLDPWITFKKPTHTANVTYTSLSDASHPRTHHYGQTGIVSGIKIETERSSLPIFHVIDWTSHKQRRVSYSSYGAEILAAASADDRGYYFKCGINNLFPHVHRKHEVVVDSQALFDTITTLHESSDYRLRPTVQRMRDSFESRELDMVRCIPGKINFADALTKRNTNLYAILNRTCTSGILMIDLEKGHALDSIYWR